VPQAAQQAAGQAQANGTSASAQSGLQVAVRPNAASSQVRLLGGNTVAYNLCGIGGKNCSIGTGAPSTDRLLLLRREALELALYTFKYLGGTDNVLAVLPPGHSQATSRGWAGSGWKKWSRLSGREGAICTASSQRSQASGGAIAPRLRYLRT